MTAATKDAAAEKRSPSRRRSFWVIACAATIVLGLLSRHRFVVPAIGKYPGDALWAIAVFCAVGVVRPFTPLRVRIAVAAAIACAIEFSQLISTPAIDALRKTVVGHLFLGSTFATADLSAYAVGLLCAGSVDAWYSTRIRREDIRHRR